MAAERPEVATQALLTIKAASKDGLRELRAILNVLRRADEADPTQPAPGIDQIGTLVERARQVGLETTFSVAGLRRPLSAAVEQAAYRIVQESRIRSGTPGHGRGVAHLPERGTAGRDHRYRPGARRDRFRTGGGRPA